jgi:hypothetical protein
VKINKIVNYKYTKISLDTYISNFHITSTIYNTLTYKFFHILKKVHLKWSNFFFIKVETLLFSVKYHILIYIYFHFFTKFLILLKNCKSIFIKKWKRPTLKTFLEVPIKRKKKTLQPRSSYIQYKKI